MKKLYMDTGELATRWHINSATLNQWRWSDRGPKYVRMNGRVLYEIHEIKKFEATKRDEKIPRKNLCQKSVDHLEKTKKAS